METVYFIAGMAGGGLAVIAIVAYILSRPVGPKF